MSFVSTEFAILFSVFLVLLAAVKSRLGRKVLLLCVSCAFYAYWDWRFLGLLATVTVVDYYIAHALEVSSKGQNGGFFLPQALSPIWAFCSFSSTSTSFSRTSTVLSPRSVFTLPFGISSYPSESPSTPSRHSAM